MAKEGLRAAILNAPTVAISLKEARKVKRRRGAGAGEEDKRPVLRLTGGELHNETDFVENVLLESGVELYTRGGQLVQPLWPKADTKGAQADFPKIGEASPKRVREVITSKVQCQKFDARLEDWRVCDAPLWLADTLVARQNWRLPPLRGIVNMPTLRDDGSLVDVPGYDPRSALIYAPGEIKFPPIPRKPGRKQATEAHGTLRWLLDGFKFVSAADRAVALAAMLTACSRHAFATAPLFAFTAPVAGSGKSLLVDLVSLMATGRRAAVIALGAEIEELEKRLGAEVLGGSPIIALDNVERALGGEFLCQVLTQEFVKVRVLGRSANLELPARATVLATGNNLVLRGDLTRRALLCSLDPGVERPELREFDFDPAREIEADRGRFVAAALTVLRAFVVAGFPVAPAPFGSFEGWSRIVRGALLWLGEVDPTETIEKSRATDPVVAALGTVMTLWSGIQDLGAKRVSVARVIEVARSETREAVPPYRATFDHPEFREALLAIAGDGGAINGRRLGKWLSAHQGRIVGGQRIVSAGISAGIGLWRIERVHGG